jgi:hypothetical protein
VRAGRASAAEHLRALEAEYEAHQRVLLGRVEQREQQDEGEEGSAHPHWADGEQLQQQRRGRLQPAEERLVEGQVVVEQVCARAHQHAAERAARARGLAELVRTLGLAVVEGGGGLKGLACWW